MNIAKTFKVQVKKDHLEKVAAGKPKTGLCELIWNALDADATEVNLHFVEGAMGVDTVIISDNGTGIAYGDAERLFVGLGGSWKSSDQRTPKGRFLHGQEGQGRFKAFTIGRVADWKVVYKEDDKFYQYTIEGCADAIDEFSLSSIAEADIKKTGVTVEISEISKNFHILDEDKALEELAPVFALYLRNYSGITLRINGQKIDPEKAIKSTKVIDQPNLNIDGVDHKVDVEIVEWSDIPEKEIWFSDAKGFPLESYEKQIRGVGDNGFSAYIRSDYFRDLHNKGLLSLRDLEVSIRKCCEIAINSVKEHFLNQALEDAREPLIKSSFVTASL